MMKQEEKAIDDKRRKFLSGVAAAGVGSAVAVAMPSAAIAVSGASVEERAEGEGYRLSQHIIDYYKSVAS